MPPDMQPPKGDVASCSWPVVCGRRRERAPRPAAAAGRRGRLWLAREQTRVAARAARRTASLPLGDAAACGWPEG